MIEKLSDMTQRQRTIMAVTVAALGYFVDVYDIAIFSIVRIASLRDLGLAGDELLSTGVFLLNAQLVGMLIGGLLWGIWGDRRGRIQVLFGSILLYSLANFANAFVESIASYAILRFVAGVGLAGEVGAGITLVSELMPKETRGIGTTIVATVGVSGAVVAGLIGDLFDWRTVYIVGGLMGLALLVLRISVHESGMFQSVQKQPGVVFGDLRLFFTSRQRFFRYLNCIIVAMPIWFTSGIVITFSPEIGKALGINGEITTARAVIFYMIGATAGDLASGLLSQLTRNRKVTIFLFMAFAFAVVIAMLNGTATSAGAFYAWCLPLGFFVGYWAVSIATAAEQFGTNLRATVATSVPNFVRGSAVIMTSLFGLLRSELGVVASAEVIGVAVFALAFLSLSLLHETYGIDLNFIETADGVKPGPQAQGPGAPYELERAEGWL